MRKIGDGNKPPGLILDRKNERKKKKKKSVQF